MRNLRPHLMTLGIALFALAVGIALGAGPLDKAASNVTEPSLLTSGGEGDEALAGFESAFAADAAGDLLNRVLQGQSVVVMVTPDADDADVSGVSAQLKAAGADITGQVDFTDKLVDAANRQFVEGVAQQSGGDVPAVRNADSSYAGIGAALGRAFLAKKPGRIDDSGATITSAFSQGELLTTSDKLTQQASVAVLIVGSDRDDGVNTVISSMLGAIDRAGRGAVVVGPSASSESGGLLDAIRSSDVSADVSTVDVSNSVAGRIVAALAVAREVRGDSGAWGTERSGDGAIPQ